MDKKRAAGILLTDLSKAFDSLDHELLIAKLEAYGFTYDALKLIHSYLSNRYQRVRINSSFSFWLELLFGVPQGSILGHILFNIFLADMFLFVVDTDIANFADDNSPFFCSTDTDTVIKQLQKESEVLLNWFVNNRFKANPDKFYLLLSEPNETYSIQLDQFVIENSTCEKLL